MLRFSNVNAIIYVCSLLLFSNANAATYVFGKDGTNQDLTSLGSGASWSSSDSFVVAGDVYVDDNDTLTLGSGVEVLFGGHRSTTQAYPEIEVKGTIIVNGTLANPVVFKNESGKTRGLFEGIYLNGDSTGTSSDYEGTIKGSYAHFLYGGKTTGVARIGKNGYLELDNSIFRYSDNHEIYYESINGWAELDQCMIDSCDYNGIAWSAGATDNGSFSITDCSFTGIDCVAVDMPRMGPGRDQPEINHSFLDAWVGVRIRAEDAGEIRNNIFMNGAIALVLHPYVYCPDGESLIFKNNAVIGMTSGIGVSDLDYETQANEVLRLVVHNNIFWDIAQDGIRAAGFNTDNDGGEDFPVQLGLQLNVFDECGDNDVQLDFVGEGEEYQIPTNNAFEVLENVSADLLNDDCINRPADGYVFVDETWGDDNGDLQVNDPESFDFHVRWNGNNALINVPGGNIDDVDGTDADAGCYGGPFGDQRVGTDNDGEHLGGMVNQDWDVDATRFNNSFYIDLGPGGIQTDGLIIPATDYYLRDQDFNVPSNYEYIINAGAVIAVHSVTAMRDIDVNGTLTANGAVNNLIRFVDGTCGNALGWDASPNWWGIYIDGGNGQCDFDYVEICGAGDGVAGFEAEDADVIGDVELTNCIIHHNDIGILLDNSCAEISDCEIHNNDSHGIEMLNVDAGVIYLNSVNVHDNGSDIGDDAGINLANSHPDFDRSTVDEDISTIDDNAGYGIYCFESDPNLNTLNRDGYTQVNSNSNSAFYLDDSYPTMTNGHNNIDPPNDAPVPYAIEFPALPDSWVGAINNWWGTADADDDEDELFSHGRVLYDPWCNLTHVPSDLTDFDIAKRQFEAGEYRAAIPHFQRAVYDEDLDGERYTALRWLKGCYKLAGIDYEDLREFYGRAAEELEIRRLAFEAGRLEILTLGNMGRHQDVVNAFLARRELLVNRADSLLNEIDLLYARFSLAKRDVNRSRIANSLIDLKKELTELKRLRKEAMNDADCVELPETIQFNSAFPNPFNNKTRLSFQLNDLKNIKVVVYNKSGRTVAILDQGERTAGYYDLIWDASGVSTGVYFARLEAGDLTRTQKLMLVR